VANSEYQPSHDIDRFDFTKDLAFGHQGEEIVKQFLNSLSQGSFEVKYDRYRNGNMVVETEQNPRGSGWKPSGINVTKAHWWVYMHSPDAFIITSVNRLKTYLEINKKYLTYKDLAKGSDNPTKGYILYPSHITDLLNNEEYDGK
jgi:hypothetical protein